MLMETSSASNAMSGYLGRRLLPVLMQTLVVCYDARNVKVE